MAWDDRIVEAAYTSPSGTRQTFIFEDVSRSYAKKTTAFDFVDADGTYIQDQGQTGRRYPLACIFSGEDCDLEADAFEQLLSESGPGILEHPVYGRVDVVPFGDIRRDDKVNSAAGQSVVTVTFWESNGLVYPTGQSDPASEVASAIDGYNAAASDNYGNMADVESTIAAVRQENYLSRAVVAVRQAVKAVSIPGSATADDFETAYQSIAGSLSSLITDQSTLSAQIIAMVQTPAKSTATPADKLSTYASLSESVTTGDAAVREPSLDNQSVNEFAADDMLAGAYTAAMVVSVVSSTFITRPEAIAAADKILSEFDTLSTWRENNLSSLSITEGGGAYQQLQKTVALAAGYLIDISFSLKQERTITLDRARTIVDLCFELYGSIDDTDLDFLISSNDLSGDEILELPRGREIAYYV